MNIFGKKHEDKTMKEEIKEKYPNLKKEDFLQAFADKNPYNHLFEKKGPVYENMDDIDNWETESISEDNELTEDVWHTGSSINDDYDGYGELDYFSELQRNEKNHDKFKELVKHNEDLMKNDKFGEFSEADEIDISTPEGIIDSIDASYTKEMNLKNEARAKQKILDKKKIKDAQWSFRKLKYSADWHGKKDLPVMKVAYENYYQNFLLKSSQRIGDTTEFNRLSKLDGKMDMSGKIFANQSLKEDAVDYAMMVRKEKIETGDWQKMPGKLLSRLQYDSKHKCLKTFEDTVIKTKNESGQVVMQDVRIIYSSNRNDRISNVYKVTKKINDFQSHGKNIKVYEIEFQPPFFERNKNKKEGSNSNKKQQAS